jgi:uncharacterized membrane protein
VYHRTTVGRLLKSKSFQVVSRQVVHTSPYYYPLSLWRTSYYIYRLITRHLLPSQAIKLRVMRSTILVVSRLIFLSSCEAFVNPHSRLISRVGFSCSTSTPPRGMELTLPALTNTDDSEGGGPTKLEKIGAAFSTSAATRMGRKYGIANMSLPSADRLSTQLKTVIRVFVPSILAGVLGTLLFPGLALGLASMINDAGVFAVLSQDSSQFVQNYLSVASLLFSILAGQTYYFMYQQQESVYLALFNEVTEAKSLLEQVALVCQGRSMYKKVLSAISAYVKYDLKNLHADPAMLLSSRPMDDPLESIMYMTSVGVPSTVYETVRSLRQARAGRLGALQRKLPQVHMLLLWILSANVLVSFPLLGAGTQIIGGYKLLTIEGLLFGVMTAGIVLTLRVSYWCKWRLDEHFY